MKGLRPRPERALELCCGTGLTALALARLGLAVEALDLNPAFVRMTRARARAAGRRVVARRGDMRAFRLPKPVDLVTCLFDSLNHVPERADLPAVFRCVHNALTPGGTFLFDVNLPHGLAADWPAMKVLWKGRGWFAVGNGAFEPGPAPRGGKAVAAEGRATFAIHWFTRGADGAYTPRIERYSEVAWTDREIRAALAAAGFTRVKRLADPELAPFRGAGGRGRAFYRAERGD